MGKNKKKISIIVCIAYSGIILSSFIGSNQLQNNTTQVVIGKEKDVHTHSYAQSIVAPTCLEQGYTVHTCTCTDTYIDGYTLPLGHDMSDWYIRISPTASYEGINERKCKRCGYIEIISTDKLKSNFNVSSKAQEVVNLVNAERIKNGLTELEVKNNLSLFATTRCHEISQLFSHIRPNNSKSLDEIFEYGYVFSGENIAKGYSSEQDVVKAWLNSAKHRDNILNPDFKYIGVDYYSYNGTVYWVQTFAG